MEIVSLNSALEPIFWEYVNQDILHFYFYVLDWINDRNQTKILLALDRNRIKGMMLIFRQEIVQLRGSSDAVKALLGKLNLSTIELQDL